MDILLRFAARIITGLISIIDASRLRNNLYQIKEEHELMWTALDDIGRMYPDHGAGKIARDTLKNVDGKYGR